METEDLINYLDELLLSQTGKHLDNLQLSILKGVLNGQKYADIAEDYHCSNDHAKDKAYELWKILSEALGEDLNKSNFKATIQRLGIANNNSKLFNPVQIAEINLCSNIATNENKDLDFNKNNRNNQEDFESKVSIKTIKKLKNLGLTNGQIAEALDLSLEDINKAIN
ncbi:hypothetical protein [Geminocystis herdmanii]|uniref:hypothetical protein n=1 Tax=Geminocystis herdmanii TaxID=669359 RepID=UPI00034828E2|nr:hypothetical protein [Geminocystis herdmanii]